jgi:proline iminopeptidase
VSIHQGTPAVTDVELHHQRLGEGPPLVFVHGGPGIGHHYLREGMDELAEAGFELIYYDQRGSGGTPIGDPDRVTFAGGIEDLDRLRRELGLDQLNLVGHSFGAVLALLYAAEHPTRTRSLLLCNTAPPFEPALQSAWMSRMQKRTRAEDAAEIKRIEESDAFRRRDPATVERYFKLRYAPFFRDRENLERATLGFNPNTAANVVEAWERTFRDLEDHDPMATLAKVGCPTLVVHGEHDPVPAEFARLIAEGIDGAEYAFLEGSSHFAYLEDPALFLEAVLPFLRRVAAEEGSQRTACC